MKTLIIIPARLESSRLPRKLLLAETGMPLIQHVIDQAKKSRCFMEFELADEFDSPIVVMSCDDEIINAADSAGVRTWRCIREYPNGTARAGELREDESVSLDWGAVCIVQGDEPEINPELIDLVVSELEQHPEWDCATAAISLSNPSTRHSKDGILPSPLDSRDRVKVWFDYGRAVNFSRSRFASQKVDASEMALHIGIYAYRRDALLRYAAAGPCEREQSESLEQLRALHIGLKMGVVLWAGEHHGGIDTREDYDRFVARWKARQ